MGSDGQSMGVTMIKAINRLKKALKGEWRYKGREWRYKGTTNRYMDRHSWTDGSETVHVFLMDGAGHHQGFVVEAERSGGGSTLQITNGFAPTLSHALILADMHMREDMAVSAFMASDMIESDYGPGDAVRQDEWLEVHGTEYEFQIIDPTEVKSA